MTRRQGNLLIILAVLTGVMLLGLVVIVTLPNLSTNPGSNPDGGEGANPLAVLVLGAGGVVGGTAWIAVLS